MSVNQRTFGILNSQTVVNNNIIVDNEYLRHLLTFQNNPSDVNQVVLHLFNTMTGNNTTVEKRALPPEIEAKINYNNVVRYRPLIEQNFSENAFYLDSAYSSLDYDTPGRKKIFLSYINTSYLSILGTFMERSPSVDKLDVIRSNADNIIIELVNLFLLRISNNQNSIEHLSSEAIEYNVLSIVFHAFVDCKVLENPNNNI